MIRDLVEASVRMVKAEKLESVKVEAARAAENRLVEILSNGKKPTPQNQNPLLALLPGQKSSEPEPTPAEKEQMRNAVRMCAKTCGPDIWRRS